MNEEYAAQKKQEREELWAEVDAKAQDVFKDGESLKGFLDFMAQCRPQKTANLLLLYSQNPEIRQVKTFEKWKEEGRTIKSGVHGYRFIASQKYEKDGVTEQGYTIRRVYDVSQVRMKQPEPPEPKSTDELMAALLRDNKIDVQVADNLPDNVQAQYISKQRTVYVRNGMDVPPLTGMTAVTAGQECQRRHTVRLMWWHRSTVWIQAGSISAGCANSRRMAQKTRKNCGLW